MRRKYGLIFLAVLPLSQLLLLSGYLREYDMSAASWIGVLLNLIGDSFLIYAMIWGFPKEKRERKLEEYCRLREAEHIQNERLEQARQEFQTLRQGLNRRLEEIQSQLDAGEREAAGRNIAEVQRTLEATRNTAFCLNEVVNAILSEKYRQCENQKIRTDFELLVPRMLKIDPLHLCSIFSNLLDNAIEAVAELPEEERQITLRAELKNLYLVVKTENPALRTHAERRTRKGHGYGTQILNSIAKKYEGTYRSGYEDGVYRAMVAVKVG